MPDAHFSNTPAIFKTLSATVTTPASGTIAVYTKTDLKLYTLDESGVETSISNGGNTYTTVNTNSANWQSTYTNFNSQSANNTSVYTTVNSNSAASVAGSIGLTIDGGGSAITTGTKGSISIPYNATITNYTLVADTTGSIVVDIKKSTYANFPTVASICAAALPTLASAQKATDSTLTGWTKTITNGDVLQFVVNSASTVTKVTLTLGVNKY